MVKVTKMVGALAVEKTAPGCKVANSRSAINPPRRFGGAVAERGRKILENMTINHQQDRSTIIPAGMKAAEVQNIIAKEKEIAEKAYEHEKPTYKPGRDSKPEKESKMLSPESMESKSTGSFAPPPLPSIPGICFDDVEVTVEDEPAEIKPSRVTPTGGVWYIDGELPLASGQ